MSGIILAIDTSCRQGSIALVAKDRLLAERILEDGLEHGRMLLPAIRDMLAACGLLLSDLQALACGIGPGSYTGTRIGVMAAKSLAFASGKKVSGVSSLAALALSVKEAGEYIVPVQDARRDEVYTAVYSFNSSGLPVQERADVALTPEEAALLAVGKGYTLVGSAVVRYPEIFEPLESKGVRVERSCFVPGASALGRIAHACEEKFVDPLMLEPVYMRRDDAPCTFERFMK